MRKLNTDYRQREYLYKDESAKLIKSCEKFEMYPQRNKWIIFFMLKHGLRVTELIKMKWDQIDFNRRLLTVKRLKSGKTSTQKISLGQVEFLMSVQAKNWMKSEFIFINHRTHKYITAGGINRMIRKAGEHAGLDYMKLHSHMMRHSCGHYLIENEDRALRFIQSWLGHVKPESTAHYTQHSSKKFDGWFEDFETEVGAA
jgi:integrase